jgi:hypothetical protein
LSPASFAPGATVVRRDVLRGRVWSARPHRVVHDRDGELLLAHWPGIVGLAPTTWIEWLRTGEEATRKQAIPNLARGTWRLGNWAWRDTVVLSWFGVDEDFSIHRFRWLEDGRAGWYVNFERPARRTASGVDTFDLLLDLAATADLARWGWKDEDEYAQARRLGVVDDADHRRVEQARGRAVAMLEARGGPFGHDWSHWSVDPEWPRPVLPDHVLETAETQGVYEV